MKNIFLSRCAAELGVGVGAVVGVGVGVAVAVAVGVDSGVVWLADTASRRQVHEIYGKRQPNRAPCLGPAWPGSARLGLAWSGQV